LIEGQTFTLTTNIDTATAETFNGIVGIAAGANTTLNTGDTLTGSNAATSTLNLTGLGTAAAPGAIATTSKIPTINYRGVGANGAQVDNINQLLMAGVSAVNSNQSISDLAVVNGVLATTYALNNGVSTGAGAANNPDLTITYAASELAGSADTAKFSVNNAGVINTAETAFSTLTIGNAATGVATTALERVQVTTAGSNNIALTLNSDITRINGAGSGTNLIAIAGNNATSLIDFSASTGTNSYLLGAGLSTNDSVTGGTGSDTVRATLAGVAGGLVFTGVETLRLNAGSAGTANFTTATGLTTLDNRSGNNVNTITGVSALTTLDLVGAGTAAAQNAGTTTLTTALSGSADTLAINVSNAGTAATVYQSIVNVSGAETINVTTTDATVGVINTLTLQSATATTVTGTTTLKLVSPGGVTLNGYGATTTTAGGSLTSLDASGVAGVFNSGNLVANSFASGASILLGAGGSAGAGNVLNVGAEAATDSISITGGSWVDTVTVGAGIYTATLGGGGDSFNGFGATQINVQGGDGNDTVTASLGADTIIGNAGANTYSFAIGAAAVNAVAQVDSITVGGTGWAIGNTITVTLNGSARNYLVTAADIAGADDPEDAALIAASLTTFINASFGGTVAATNAAAVVTVTASTPGTAFTLTSTDSSATGTVTRAAVTANTPAVAAANSTSNLAALDLLTYVSANGDIITGTNSTNTAQQNISVTGAAVAATATGAAVNAAGLVTGNNTTAAPTTLNQAFAQVEAVVGISGTPGRAAVFNFGGQAYLFVSDGVAGLSNGDIAIQLTGINTLATGLTISATNNISAIA